MKLGPKACRSCKIRAGLGSCSVCSIRAYREGGADGIAGWAACLQKYLNETELGRQLLEFDRQNLRDWLNGYDLDFSFGDARSSPKHGDIQLEKRNPKKPRCTCAVLDNRDMPPGLRWFSADCPVHPLLLPAPDRAVGPKSDLTTSQRVKSNGDCQHDHAKEDGKAAAGKPVNSEHIGSALNRFGTQSEGK